MRDSFNMKEHRATFNRAAIINWVGIGYPSNRLSALNNEIPAAFIDSDDGLKWAGSGRKVPETDRQRIENIIMKLELGDEDIARILGLEFRKGSSETK